MLESLRKFASKVVNGVRKETEVLRTLNKDVQATIARLARRDPGLPEFLRRAYAYAVFPSVGKAGAVIGGAFGKGEVFRRDGRLVGYAAVAQLTIGVQLGGQTFTEIVCFESKAAFDRFKHGKQAFAASASAVLLKAGAAASADFERGVAVFVYAEGGMELEAAIGGQKFFFRSAFLGRFTRAPRMRPAKPSRAGTGPRRRGPQSRNGPPIPRRSAATRARKSGKRSLRATSTRLK